MQLRKHLSDYSIKVKCIYDILTLTCHFQSSQWSGVIYFYLFQTSMPFELLVDWSDWYLVLWIFKIGITNTQWKICSGEAHCFYASGRQNFAYILYFNSGMHPLSLSPSLSPCPPPPKKKKTFFCFWGLGASFYYNCNIYFVATRPLINSNRILLMLHQKLYLTDKT